MPLQLQHLGERVLTYHQTDQAPEETQAAVTLCPNRKPLTGSHGKEKATSEVTLRHTVPVVIQNGVLPPVTPKRLLRRTAQRIHPPAAAKSTLRRSTSAVVRRRITEISRHPDKPKQTCQKVIAGKSHKRRERNFMRSQGLKKREASRVEPCTTQRVNVEGASPSAVAPQRPSMPRVRAKATTGQNACRRDAPAISITSRTKPAGNSSSRSETSMCTAVTID